MRQSELVMPQDILISFVLIISIFLFCHYNECSALSHAKILSFQNLNFVSARSDDILQQIEYNSSMLVRIDKLGTLILRALDEKIVVLRHTLPAVILPFTSLFEAMTDEPDGSLFFFL